MLTKINFKMKTKKIYLRQQMIKPYLIIDEFREKRTEANKINPVASLLFKNFWQ